LDHSAAVLPIPVADGKKTQKALAPARNILRARRLQAEALSSAGAAAALLGYRYGFALGCLSHQKHGT